MAQNPQIETDKKARKNLAKFLNCENEDFSDMVSGFKPYNGGQ